MPILLASFVIFLGWAFLFLDSCVTLGSTGVGLLVPGVGSVGVGVGSAGRRHQLEGNKEYYNKEK